MSSIATFECYGKPWIADQVYGESPRHLEIAAGAHNKRTPYCRKHLLGMQQRKVNSFPEGFRSVLLAENFDLSADFDLLVVQHDLAQDPLEELLQLQVYGREILRIADREVPDFAFLDTLPIGGINRVYTESYLSSSDNHDLTIARRALTSMLLDRHND